MNAHNAWLALTSQVTDSLAISLRAYVTDPQAKPRSPRKPRQSPALRWTLVFDTETTTDPSQRLRFGSYQLRNGQALDEAGLFFDPEALSEAERRTLEILRRLAWPQMHDAHKICRGRLLPSRL